ncbi:MAG: hypothetical protein R6X23_11380 [Acidimicrobiia bacterium]
MASSSPPPSDSPPPPAGDARRPLLRHPGRVAIVAVIAIAILNLGIVLLDASDTSETGIVLPSTVESVFPEPGSLARLRDTIVVDLRDDLTGVLVIDGAEVPEDQTDRVVPLAQVSFRPGDDRDITAFTPGSHAVTIRYWKQGKPRPAQPGSYSWSFRAGA